MTIHQNCTKYIVGTLLVFPDNKCTIFTWYIFPRARISTNIFSWLHPGFFPPTTPAHPPGTDFCTYILIFSRAETVLDRAYGPPSVLKPC